MTLPYQLNKQWLLKALYIDIACITLVFSLAFAGLAQRHVSIFLLVVPAIVTSVATLYLCVWVFFHFPKKVQSFLVDYSVLFGIPLLTYQIFPYTTLFFILPLALLCEYIIHNRTHNYYGKLLLFVIEAVDMFFGMLESMPAAKEPEKRLDGGYCTGARYEKGMAMNKYNSNECSGDSHY